MCYRLVDVGANDAPLLKEVAATYILTMEDTKRVVDVEAAKLLTGRTVLQVNKGFRNCHKPGVTKANQDISHAYRNLSRTILATTTYERVLILEDDFIVENKDPACYREIDDFLAQNRCDVYTLGSIGIHLPIGSHHKFLWGMVMCQACVWSRKALATVAEIDCTAIGHFDNDVLSPMRNKYGYKRALITQTFPDTDNFHTWPTTGKWSMRCLRSWFKINERPQPGWDAIYLVSGPVFFALLVLVVVVALPVVFRRVNRTRLTPGLQS